MRRNPDKKDQNKNKQEKLTPQQVWKNASMLIGTKKKETPLPKESPIRQIDFSDIQNKIKEISDAKSSLIGSREEFYKVELKNSLFHIPDFSDIEGQPTTKNKTQVPDFFPKQHLNIFESPDIYKKLDIDTLFFIFYSQPIQSSNTTRLLSLNFTLGDFIQSIGLGFRG